MSGKTRALIALSCVWVFVATSLSAQADLVSLRATNYPSFFFGWDGSDGVLIEPVDPVSAERATFRIVPGLSDPAGVSIQCATDSNYYLRHENGALRLHKSGTADSFGADATFRKVMGLTAGESICVSFEAVNLPGNYIRHRNMRLALDPFEDSDLYKNDATFVIEPPKWDGKKSLTKPGEPHREPIDAKQMGNLFLFIVLAVSAIGLNIYAVTGKTR